MADDTTRVDYLTQEEVDALREEFGVTRPLTGNRYVGVNPNTGERGIFLFNPQGGWMDMTKSTGPRTTYEDGSPVTSFADVNANRNWVSRLYDIMRLASGFENYVSSPKTVIGLGVNRDPKYTPFNWRSEYYNSPEFTNVAHQLARGDMSFDEIYKAMQDWYAAKTGASTVSESAAPAAKEDIVTPSVTIGSTGGGAFTGVTPQTFTYTPSNLPSVAPAPSVKNVDYVKLLRGWLTNSLFKDLI